MYIIGNAIVVLLIITLAIFSYNTYIAYRMKIACAKIERDPKTGIIKGAEPIYLRGNNKKAVLWFSNGFWPSAPVT